MLGRPSLKPPALQVFRLDRLPSGLPTCLSAGIEKHGGRVLLRSHVEQVLVEGGRAAGVRLRGSGGSGDEAAAEVIRARRAVVSNASVWDTLRLLPEGERVLLLGRAGLYCAVFSGAARMGGSAGTCCTRDACAAISLMRLPQVRCRPTTASSAQLRHAPPPLSICTWWVAFLSVCFALFAWPACWPSSRCPCAAKSLPHAPHAAQGIDATALPEDLECHHLVTSEWGNFEVSLQLAPWQPGLQGTNAHVMACIRWCGNDGACKQSRQATAPAQRRPSAATRQATTRCTPLPAASWPLPLQAPQNVVNVSIPTVFDPSLAPPGKHLIHAYTGKAGRLPVDGCQPSQLRLVPVDLRRSASLWGCPIGGRISGGVDRDLLATACALPPPPCQPSLKPCRLFPMRLQPATSHTRFGRACSAAPPSMRPSR